LFFTGLSGAGQSTLANAVAIKLMELQDRHVTLLDGDVIRHHLSSGLGFSKEDRSLNIRRVGYVASEITKNRGIAICSMIAPYEIDRNYNRSLIEPWGNFIEIYVSTSLEVCLQRDTKGLYSLAKAGKLKGLTGVDDPYEPPANPELNIDTSLYTVPEAVEQILDYLRTLGHIK
jgi:sulfate adenylyltransferase